MRNVVSFCVFGGNQDWWGHFPMTLAAHLQLFPGWELRLYHDPAFESFYYFEGLKKIEADGWLKLVRCQPAPLTLAMLWRMKPVWDSGVDVVACRDLDALVCGRERRCLEHFISTGLPAHAIRDSIGHMGVYMLGGMVAFRSPAFKSTVTPQSWQKFVDSGVGHRRDWNRKGEDQEQLHAEVWNKFPGRVCDHAFLGQPPHEGNPKYNLEDVRRFPVADVSNEVLDFFDSIVPHIGSAGLPHTDIPKALRDMLSIGRVDNMRRLQELIQADSGLCRLAERMGHPQFQYRGA